MDLNKVMIIGRLTQDPEIRTTPTGQNVASFSVATNLVWNDQSGQKQEKVEFHNIVAWRRLAEIIGQYLKKGSKVYLEGRLQTRDWTGNDGVKRYRTEIIADNMIMLDTKSAGQGFAPAPAQPNTFTAQPAPISEPTIDYSEPVAPSAPAPTADDDIKVENIPF